ncbi:DUF6266 family protein [Pedobacter xixiisoli]|uniref:Uncharacterized protein n=1 Tax=Pedobacter xixiisoli TaxID=1476464 RepID=A0A285ZXH6_9SPHI|nr:DUF6266 family protein [Pedobacter xixiisoli]SOD14338.1 hypothetical protein SAMN06297358_1524 [Pedobacter xixiisoli]
MGKIEQGILGAFSGTVGTVVGSSWRGIHYMRGKSTSRRQTSTFKQDEQRARFQLMVRFVRQLSPIIEIGFKRLANQMTASNAALSYNLKNGISGTYPNFSIAYNMVLLSRGDLPTAVTPSAAAAGTQMTFNWTDNSGNGKALGTDLCVIAIYCPQLNMTICNSLNDGVTRADQTLSINVPAFAGQEVETYISFFSANGKEVSDSFYTGTVLVA